MYEQIKREILESARKLDRYGIIKLSAGNLSVRCGQAREHVVVTPSSTLRKCSDNR